MRLLNVRTFKLEEFFGKAVPPYAVLSHTWGNDKDEVSFRDVENGSSGKTGPGMIKIVGCCKQAMKDGLNYAWIDTCCIDKANSVELGEAINSMFQWYANASICYAYLSDVPAGENPRDHGSSFSSSRWFTRGWTLQELLAPKELRFYDSIWSCLGTRRTLSVMVQKITGIPRPFLIGLASLHEASVAQRMSWASKRVTGRKEDIAYCLLGIFGVVLPMIYGEGDQAFTRLQEAIMKHTEDNSILAWGFDPLGSASTNSKDVVTGGILAAAPADFENCGHIVSREQPQSPLEISGGRLHVQWPLYTTSAGETYGLLNCGPNSEVERVVGIPLVNNVSSELSNEYIRPQGHRSTLLPRTKSNSSTKLIHIQMGHRSRAHTGVNRRHWFYIDDPSEANLELVEVEPLARWQRARSMITTENNPDESFTQRTLTRFRIENQASYDFIVMLEFKTQGSQVEARCHVMISSRDTTLEALSQKFTRMREKVFGKQSATNGVLSIYVTVTQESIVGQPMFVVKLATTPSLPEITIDATKELQILDLQLELEGLLQEDNYMDLEAERLRQQEEEETRSLQQMEQSLAVVEKRLRELGEERNRIVDRLERGHQEVDQIITRSHEIMQRKEELSSQKSEILARLSTPALEDMNSPESPTKVKFVVNVDNLVKDIKLERFFEGKQFTKELAEKAADLKNDPTTPLGNEDLLPKTIKVSLHQQVIYCDDSGSMRLEGRFDFQTRLVKRITQITTRILPEGEGVALRFINQNVEDDSSNLTLAKVGNILTPMTQMANGSSNIGTNLKAKILEPLVYSKIKAKSLERPLLIFIITDSMPEPEHESELVSVIFECGERLQDASYRRESVKFLVGQIGSARRAKEFLNGLRNFTSDINEVANVVYCIPDQLDAKFSEFREDEGGIDRWLIETLFSPIENCEDK
ncbi:HET-domain-containing protein [Acephala macrosclerotiorum]|nr:HET-domain-containing protein [Acephala macrosclerotiorum]